jgi:hypothetical protein
MAFEGIGKRKLTWKCATIILEEVLKNIFSNACSNDIVDNAF